MKLIAVSGGGGSLSVRDCLPIAEAMGAQKSFSKPFDNKEFLEEVKELLLST